MYPKKLGKFKSAYQGNFVENLRGTELAAQFICLLKNILSYLLPVTNFEVFHCILLKNKSSRLYVS